MTNPQGPPIPAGWFRDPGGSEQLRWWDGNAWTAHLAPVPAPQPTPTIVSTPTVAPTATIAPASQVVAADPDERPYVPFQNSWSSAASGYGTGPGEFARPAQWNTAGVWFLATAPIWSPVLSVVLAVLVGILLGSNFASISTLTSGFAPWEFSGSFLFLVIELLAAGADRAKLKRMGYLTVTSPLWILLLFSPLIYLILRTIRVKRESGRGLAPILFYAISAVSIVAISVVAAILIPAVFAANDAFGTTATETSNATSMATEITTGMEKNGGSYSVTCTPFANPTTSPVDVTCIAVDLTSQKSHTLQIEVDPATTGGGQPTVKLLSVNPPINQ